MVMDMGTDTDMEKVVPKNHDGSDALTCIDREVELSWENGSSTCVSVS